MRVHWGWYVQICGVSYGENISYWLLKCSPTTSYLNFNLARSELRAIHPYHPASKAGFGEEVSVVEGLGCIIGRLFSLLAIDWSCLGLAADQSLFIRSRKRLWIWKKKKRLMLKNVFHMWGKITLWIFFFFFLRKHISVQRRKICSSRQEWSMCTNLAHEMQRR